MSPVGREQSTMAGKVRFSLKELLVVGRAKQTNIDNLNQGAREKVEAYLQWSPIRLEAVFVLSSFKKYLIIIKTRVFVYVYIYVYMYMHIYKGNLI